MDDKTWAVVLAGCAEIGRRVRKDAARQKEIERQALAYRATAAATDEQIGIIKQTCDLLAQGLEKQSVKNRSRFGKTDRNRQRRDD